MGNIKDITDLMRKGPQLISQLDSVKINTKSVARGANDATFQFPCLMADTIPFDIARGIINSCDRTYAAFTQSWLSLNNVMDISVDRTPVQFLKRLHNNIHIESVIEDLTVNPVDYDMYMEKVYNGEYALYTNPDKSFGVLFNVADKLTYEAMESNKNGLKEHLADFDLRPFPNVGNSPFYEAPGVENSGDLLSAVMAGNEREAKLAAQKSRMDQTRGMEKSNQLLDRDVKRTNDMVPFGMQVRLMAVNDKGEFVQYMDFVLGIKTILHPIKSDDMILNIMRVLQNKDPIFKFLRWTTGEISLFKDLILNINEVKWDMSNRNHGGSPFFGFLKRLSGKKVGVHDLTVPHGVIPSTTICISEYERSYIESKIGLDIGDPRIAKRIMQNLCLMSFIIVDTATGVIEILYDGSSQFSTTSLDSIEKEVSMSSNKLGREIGRMISH